MKKNILCFIVCVYVLVISNSCSSYKRNPSEVVIWQLADPGMLNPYLANDNIAPDIDNNIFQPLLNFDFKTLKIVPVLADSLPVVTINPAGQMLITYQLRKEAKWDNGSPVTAKDVEFSLKIIKNPLVNDEAYKSYFDLVSDIILYPNNPKKFSIVYDTKYALALITTGTDIFVLPQYVYDSSKYMEGFTIRQIQTDTSLANNAKMMAFAKEFNSEKHSRNPLYISGSGAYNFTEWVTGQRIVLKKKSNWWGEKLAGTNCFFDVYPTTLIYQTINDMTSALVSVKAGNIDAINYIKPPDFVELSKSEKFRKNFNIYQPLKLAYSYLGINVSNPKFSDVNTRKAIACLIDVPQIIKDIYYGYAQQVIGAVSLTDSSNYDYSIKPYLFNIDSAKLLLAKAGWKDSDGDGIVDKLIDGKKTDLTIEFICPSGSEQRKKVGLVFKEAARNVGILVNVREQDNNILMENLKTHNFEMYMSGWVIQPGPQDYKQIFHTTSSLNKGSNFTCFGNAESDALIDSIRVELNPERQSQMLKRLQVIMHEQCAYIFLFSQEALIAINKKYSNTYSSPISPYYWEAGFNTNATN